MKKFLSTLVVVIMAATLAIGMISCGDEGTKHTQDNSTANGNEDAKHIHDYSTAWSSDGSNHWHACKANGDCDVPEKDKAAHSWNVGEITTPATAEGDGVKTFTCTVCGKTKTESVRYEAPVITHSHDYAAEWTSDSAKHWHACTATGTCDTPKKDEKEHDFDGYICSICGYEHIHQFATEWSSDDTHHWHATACGHDSDVTDLQMSKAEHDFDGTVCSICEYIHIHQFATEWSSDDTHHWHATTCGHDSDVTDLQMSKAEHDFDSGDECPVCHANKPSEDLQFTVKNGAATLVGIGTCKDTDIVIPRTYDGKPVTTIGARAFISNATITGVTIPDSVVTIEDNAFCGCSALTRVSVGNGVETVGRAAFSESNAIEFTKYDNGLYLGNETNPHVILVTTVNKTITSCTISNTTRVLHYYAFGSCESLIGPIVIPDSVVEIGQKAFTGCSQLTGVTIGNGVKIIKEEAFYKCVNLESATIGDHVEVFQESAFLLCKKLNNIVIPNSTYFIGKSAFSCCYALSNITLGNHLETIMENAFNDCSALKSIVIPDSVTAIGDTVFMRSYALEYVVLGSGISVLGTRTFNINPATGAKTKVYYKGSLSDWNNVNRGSENPTPAFYSESEPENVSGTRWHYDEDGETILEWSQNR